MDSSFVKEIIKTFSAKGIPQLAAGLCFYALFSLAPLLIVSTSLAALVFKQSSTHMIINNLVQEWVGEQGAEFIARIMNNSAQLEIKNLTSLISAGILFFGATSVFNHVHYALNRIFGAKREWKQVLKKRIFSFLMVIGTGVVLIVSVILGTALRALGLHLPNLISDVFAMAFIWLFFLFTYRLVPDVDVPMKALAAGSFIAAFLFVLGKFVISFYVTNSSITSLYGATGSLLALLIWIYYSAQIFFLGAVIAEEVREIHSVSSQS